MIIRFYKGNISYDRLKDDTKTSYRGTTAYHMIETLNDLGFQAKGVEISNFKFITNVSFPCIAHVRSEKNIDHYIVIYKINDKKQTMIIADPSSQIKRISMKQFHQISTGVFLIMYPVRKIPVYYQYHSLFKFVFQKLYEYHNCIMKILFLSILITVFSILISFYFKFITEAISTSSQFLLSQVFIVFLVIVILKVLVDYFRNELLIYFNHRLDQDLTIDVFHKILSFPYLYFKNRTTGEVISRIQDLSKVRELLSKLSLTLSMDLLLTITAAIILIILNRKLFLISVILFLLYVIIVIIFRPKLNNGIKKITEENALIHSFMLESLMGIENIKGLDLEHKFISQFQKKYQDYIIHLKSFEKRYNLEYLCKELVNGIGILFILYVGSILVMKSELSLGELFSFYSLLFYFLNPIRSVIDLNILLFQSKHAFIRVDEILDKTKMNEDQNEDKIYQISFDNLSFSLDEQVPILKNISFSLKRGQSCMLVGESGSGKSTLLKILKGYYSISKGMLYINHKEDDKSSNIKERIVYISQNEILYTNTLYENLRLYRNVSEQEIKKICEICCIDEFVKDHNYHFLIEENGFNLSGGERQRIILGRALLNSFDVLIIDEALNQVDVNLERKIIKNIKREFYQKIMIFVSHRYDNLDLFDSFIELKDGSILKFYEKNNQ